MTEAELRRDARWMLDAGVRAVEPEGLVRTALESTGSAPAQTRVVAIGKAAAAMARGAKQSLGDAFSGGIVIAPAALVEQVPDGYEAFGGGHPEPNAAGVQGAEAIRRLASGLGQDDQLLVLISGGGSALMTLPPSGTTLEDLQQTTRLLLRAGATIQELNAVRKHLDELKGGRLARLASPAKVRALVLSDVVGDPLDVIASGPVSPDATTFADVERIVRSRGVWGSLPVGVRRHLERGFAGEIEDSPTASDPCFETVDAEVIGNNRRAALATLAEAEKRGYRPLLLSTELTGEARQAGGFLASIAREIRRSGHPLKAPACVVAAGETTVNVTGDGLGGRNQELALAAALGLRDEEAVLVAGFGTDGIDGPTDAAGAMAFGSTLRRAEAEGLDAEDYLARNDAYRFFEALHDLILTGPTGTNVMDLSLILVA